MTRTTPLVLTLVALLIVSVAMFALDATRRADPFQAASVREHPFESLTYGIQAFLWWDGGEVGFTLDWVETIGFSHIKQTFAWADMEPFQGVWDFSMADKVVDAVTARELQLIARLGEPPQWAQVTQGDAVSDITDTQPRNLSTWANYCGTLAERYAGRINAYQVWNEPNLAREWGGHAPDAAAYVRLLAACSEAIRAADPAAVIISAGLSPTGTTPPQAVPDDQFLQQMYDADFQEYVDVVGMHAPGFDAPEVGPDDAVAKGRQRWMSFRRVEDLRGIMIRNGDAARQVAILEMGYTTDTVHPEYAWFAVDEATQAAYMRRAYEYAAQHWRPWVGLMSGIYMAKPIWTEDDEEFWWSFTRTYLDKGYTRVLPVVDSVARMPKYCGSQITSEIPPEGLVNRESANSCD